MAEQEFKPFWGHFDYLKVQEFDRNVPKLEDNYKFTYSLASCVIKSSVTADYADNQTILYPFRQLMMVAKVSQPCTKEAELLLNHLYLQNLKFMLFKATLKRQAEIVQSALKLMH